ISQTLLSSAPKLSRVLASIDQLSKKIDAGSVSATVQERESVKKLAALGLFVCLTAAPFVIHAQPPQRPAETTAPQQLELTVGKSLVFETLVPIQRASLANAEIADAIVLSPKQIYITGKAIGTTNLT